LIKNRT